MQTRSLTGITWNHTRGYLPLIATAQRFTDRDPGVEIVCHKRSLQDFADIPIERLADSFDLLVIDHPFVGYAQFVASPGCQRGLYARAGGQPGHRGAWLDLMVNAGAGDFYRDTLPTLDEGYLRPRYDGYIPFQDRGGEVVHAYLRHGGDPRRPLADLNRHYRESRTDDRA